LNAEKLSNKSESNQHDEEWFDSGQFILIKTFIRSNFQ